MDGTALDRLGSSDVPAAAGGDDTAELTVQRLLFDGPSPLVSADMYSEVRKGNAERTRTGVRIAKRSVVHTNSYFGRFPASYWQRWTTVTEVVFRATVAGAGRIDLVATDYKGHERTMASTTVDSANASTQLAVPVATTQFLDGGALYVRFTT
ncbi:MAG: glycosyltransferase family 2 protein, partial [Rhodococcus sp.]|nr:glycosyltransferase family 2 protein [Rhodococcus sp. (in: high G+C Gram-positive bacteria)]